MTKRTGRKMIQKEDRIERTEQRVHTVGMRAGGRG